MKFHHAICAFFLLLGLGHLAVELHAARGAGSVVVAKPRMQSLTATPLFDDTGKLQSMQVTVKYLVDALQPDGVTRKKHLYSVDIDLVLQSNQRVIVGDEILVMGSLSDDLLTLADAIWIQRFPPPLPTLRNKSLRETGTAR